MAAWFVHLAFWTPAWQLELGEPGAAQPLLQHHTRPSAQA